MAVYVFKSRADGGIMAIIRATDARRIIEFYERFNYLTDFTVEAFGHR